MARKKRRLFSLKNLFRLCSFLIVLGLGWFGYTYFTKAKSEPAESPEETARLQKECENTHGHRLIAFLAETPDPNMVAGENSEKTISGGANIGLLGSFEGDKKVAPAAFKTSNTAENQPPKPTSNLLAQKSKSQAPEVGGFRPSSNTTSNSSTKSTFPAKPNVEKPSTEKPAVVSNIGDLKPKASAAGLAIGDSAKKIGDSAKKSG